MKSFWLFLLLVVGLALPVHAKKSSATKKPLQPIKPHIIKPPLADQVYEVFFGSSTNPKSQNTLREIFYSRKAGNIYFSGCGFLKSKVNTTKENHRLMLARILLIPGLTARECEAGKFFPITGVQTLSRQIFLRVTGKGRDDEGYSYHLSIFFSSMPPVCEKKLYRKMDKTTRQLAQRLCRQMTGQHPKKKPRPQSELYFSF